MTHVILEELRETSTFVTKTKNRRINNSVRFGGQRMRNIDTESS